MKQFLIRGLVFMLVVLMAGCVARGINPVSGNKRAFGYTWEEEQQIGRQADQQIVAQYGIYQNEELQRYIDQVGRQVLQESHLRREDVPDEFTSIDFTFRVLDSPVVNAFALPGGYVYVTRGLLAHLANEAQLAVVLGHEIGHVAARHASQRAATQQLAQLGLIGGAIAGQAILGGDAAENILGLGSQAAQLLFLSYSRENERESDRLGVEYAAMAGYEAAEGSEFFRSLQRISEQQGATLPSWQSTHPDPGEREQTIQELAAEWAERPGIEMTEVDRQEYVQHLAGLVVGDDPRQGFVRDGVFYHPELAFRVNVPRGWEVANQPEQVLMAEPNGQAYLVLQIAEQNSAEAAASAFAGQQGLTNVEQGRASANGLPARYVAATAQMEGGQTVRLLNYFVEHGGNVYSLLGLTTLEGYSTYEDTFTNAMRSFSRVTDQSILTIEPARLRLVEADRTAPFRTFLPASLPLDFTPEDVAILNQVTLDEQIEAGTVLKIPT